jgi:hypothetical protein
MGERRENHLILGLLSFEIDKAVKEHGDHYFHRETETIDVEARLQGRVVKVSGDPSTLKSLSKVLLDATLK